MNSYKVVKDLGILKKGDVMEWNDDYNAYVFSAADEESSRSVILDKNTVADLCESEAFVAIENEPTNDKVEETVNFLNNLVEGYKKDLEDYSKKYEAGEIQQCVKVEADTVLSNLIKLSDTVINKLSNK